MSISPPLLDAGSPATSVSDDAVRTSRRLPLGVVIVATSLPMFMATLDNLVMTSALPVVRADLGASVGQLSWFPQCLHAGFRDLHAAGRHDR